MNRVIKINWLIIVLSIPVLIKARVTGSSFPNPVIKNEKYLFYLHGGVVTVKGDNAINDAVPEWGPYEYSNILDSLRKRGFNVISEIRKQGVENSVYTEKIASQVDSLLTAGVPVKNIVLVGASAGWDIVMHVAAKLKNRELHYVIMGGCWPETYKDYSELVLYGHFLSIYEASDPHSTCYKVFEGRTTLTSQKEIKLNTGLSHGFIYKGYKEWIDPIVEWFYNP